MNVTCTRPRSRRRAAGTCEPRAGSGGRAGSGAGLRRRPRTPAAEPALPRRPRRAHSAQPERRGEARRQLPPGALEIALLIGLASAPSQLLRRDGVDDSAHRNALDAAAAHMSATSATTLPQRVWRSIRPSAVTHTSAPASARRARPPRRRAPRPERHGARAPSASRRSRRRRRRPGGRPSAARSVGQPPLELGDLRPGVAPFCGPNTAAAPSGPRSGFWTSSAATSSTRRRTAPSRRAGRPRRRSRLSRRRRSRPGAPPASIAACDQLARLRRTMPARSGSRGRSATLARRTPRPRRARPEPS